MGFVLLTGGLYLESWWGWLVAAAGLYLLLGGVFDFGLPGFLVRAASRGRKG